MRSGRRWKLVDEAGAALLRAARPAGRSLPLLVAVAMPILGGAPLVACNAKGFSDVKFVDDSGDTFDTGDTDFGYPEDTGGCAGVSPYDTDADNLGDRTEATVYGTDPADPDSDNDGLPDGQEVNLFHTDPLQADTDGGGAPDGVEVRVDLTDATSAGDDVADAIDLDGDGLYERAELLYGTDDTVPDSDGDLLSDGDEVNLHGTDPGDTDTDHDGADDATEVRQGSGPRDPCDLPSGDTGTPDTGTPDTGTSDTGTSDTGTSDTAASDGSGAP